MPGPLSKTQVLMLGADDALLRIRARVLETIGCETLIVSSEQQARHALDSDRPKPRLVILCHTAEKEHMDRVRSMALQAGIPTYFVEKMIPPQHLIEDINRVLKQGKPPARGARLRP